MSQYLDEISGATYDGAVGPQDNGTYQLPDAAQPNNRPWDSGGGVTGGYGDSVLDVLKLGVGAWSANKSRNDLLDYKRYEATAGGVFQQGKPAAAQVAPRAAGMGGLLPLLLIGLVVVLVVKH